MGRIEVSEQEMEMDRNIFISQNVRNGILDFVLDFLVLLRRLDFDIEAEVCLFESVVDDESFSSIEFDFVLIYLVKRMAS